MGYIIKSTRFADSDISELAKNIAYEQDLVSDLYIYIYKLNSANLYQGLIEYFLISQCISSCGRQPTKFVSDIQTESHSLIERHFVTTYFLV